MSQPGLLPLSNRGGCPYIRRLRCFGNAARIFAGSRARPSGTRPGGTRPGGAGPGGAGTGDGFRSERRAAAIAGQRRPAARRPLRLRQAQGPSRRGGRVEPRIVGALRRAGSARACPSPRNYGGFGGGPIEIMLVMEAFGRVLALEPYLATVVLSGTALRLAGSEAQKSALLPQIADGSHAARLCPWRASGALRPQRRVDRRRSRRAAAAGSSRAPRASLSTATAPTTDRQRAGFRRPRRPRGDRAVPGRCRRRTASRGAAIRCATAPARRTFR